MLAKPILKALLCFISLVPTLVPSEQAQEPTNQSAPQAQYAFDVVSIRPSAKEAYSHWRTATEGYSATNVTAQQLLFYAYTQTDNPDAFSNIISSDQITGLPKWAASEQFNVTAKLDQQTISQLSVFPERDRQKIYGKMLQSVLTERFHLEVHHQKREQSVYLLVPSREGAKLSPSNLPFSKSSLSTGHSRIQATSYTVGQLASYLAQATGRIVVDQTHLTGVYDLTSSGARTMPQTPQTRTHPSTPQSRSN